MGEPYDSLRDKPKLRLCACGRAPGIKNCLMRFWIVCSSRDEFSYPDCWQGRTIEGAAALWNATSACSTTA